MHRCTFQLQSHNDKGGECSMRDENGALTARQWHKAFFAAPLTSRTQQAYSLACWTCTWDKLPYQNLKPRRTAISLTILILLHVAPCCDGKGYFHNLNTGTSTSYVCLALPSLSGCCFPCTALRNWRFRTFRWLPGSRITSPLHWIDSITCMLSHIFGIVRKSCRKVMEQQLNSSQPCAHGHLPTLLLTLPISFPTKNVQ